jgi:hypothetical protein
LADKTSELILAALGRAAAEPAGAAMHGRNSARALFPSTNAAKVAAQRCKNEGYLQTVRTEKRAKSTLEFCTLTEKGMAFLLTQMSPNQALQDFIRAVDARRTQAGELLLSAKQMQTTLDALKSSAERVLHEACKSSVVGATTSLNGKHSPRLNLLEYLAQWQKSGASEDCPLPTLFRHALQSTEHVTIGQFHDALRLLHDQKQIYLHPWSGPLYALPEPPYALLIGHEIAYYASLRERMKEEG